MTHLSFYDDLRLHTYTLFMLLRSFMAHYSKLHVDLEQESFNTKHYVGKPPLSRVNWQKSFYRPRVGRPVIYKTIVIPG